MLNKRFEEWVKSIVGEKAYIKLKGTTGYRLAMKQFDENIKPAFRSRDDEDQYISFPMANLKDSVTKGIKSNSIILTGNSLHEIFSPVFREIDKLVAEQVNMVYIKRVIEKPPKDSIKAVFLVGGFGSSGYLREAIAHAHPDIQVIQPDDAGAVLSKLPQEATVVNNVAPKHYGVAGSSIHDPVRDEGRETYYDDFEDVWRTDVMSWYIKKDDDILRSRKIEFGFYRKFNKGAPAEDLIVKDKLLECAIDKEPVHPLKGKCSIILILYEETRFTMY
ncbi:MAG: hypothetical protein Q9214_004488 [Letrouitia sp. 1 TL-2023]